MCSWEQRAPFLFLFFLSLHTPIVEVGSGTYGSCTALQLHALL